MGYLSMGGPPQEDARLVIERFQHSGIQLQVVWNSSTPELPMDSWVEAGQPLGIPENVVAIVGSHWLRGRPGTIHVEAELGEVRIHHYLDLHGPRCKACVDSVGLQPAMMEAAARLRKLFK